MKPITHLDEDQLTLLYFKEAPDPASHHLAQCDSCRARYSELALFLDTLRDVPLPEKDTHWEQRVWAGISPRVTQLLPRPRRIQFRFWALGPALAALLIAAFLIGRYAQAPSTAPTISSNARDRVLLITLGDHLDRSQIVLAELVNAPEGKPLNIAAQQQLAGNLVGENRLLRQIVARKGDRSDTAVLDELERVLLDIANSPSDVFAQRTRTPPSTHRGSRPALQSAGHQYQRS